VSPVRRFRNRTHRERIADPFAEEVSERILHLQREHNLVAFAATRGLDGRTWELEWTERRLEGE
jgi:hypothetical protein